MDHRQPAMQTKAMAPGGGGAALRLRAGTTTTTTTGAQPDKSSRVWTTRLQKELEGLWADPPEWCVPGADATDLFHWQVVIVGPRGSPYDGGVFAVRFKFPRHYPFKPPKVTFATKVYHPNIDPKSGRVCLDFLSDSKHSWWTPAWTVDKILLVVVSLLHEPVMDGRAINPDAANLYRRKRPRYVEIARAKTREHATASASAASAAAASSEKERPQSRSVSLWCRRLMTRVAFFRFQDRGLAGLQHADCERLSTTF